VLLPCFVSHTFIDEIAVETRVPILSVMDALASHLQRRHPQARRIGVLTSGVVRRKQLFERACTETPESKALIRELVHIMRGFVPWWLGPMPAALMRSLNGARVADLLEVPRNPVLDTIIVGTRWLRQRHRLLATFARLISPRLVQWMATTPGAQGHPLLPEALARQLGSPRR